MSDARELDANFFHPFPGPCMLSMQLPAEILGPLTAATDAVLEGKAEQVDWSSELAGEIRRGSQYLLYHEEGDKPQPGPEAWGGALDLYLGFLRETAVHYAKESLRRADNPRANSAWMGRELVAKVHDSWVVSSRPGDYNPLHDHGQFISGVIYLKVPEQINADNAPAGCIDFVDRTTSFPLMLHFSPVFRVLPQESLMLVFPSWLHHTVHPYMGGGERRSVSFNVTLSPG